MGHFHAEAYFHNIHSKMALDTSKMVEKFMKKSKLVIFEFCNIFFLFFLYSLNPKIRKTAIYKYIYILIFIPLKGTPPPLGGSP
jgi:hypothetical protein